MLDLGVVRGISIGDIILRWNGRKISGQCLWLKKGCNVKEAPLFG